MLAELSADTPFLGHRPTQLSDNLTSGLPYHITRSGKKAAIGVHPNA
jgi:hypothetical protein